KTNAVPLRRTVKPNLASPPSRLYFYGGKTGAPGVTRDGAENTNDLLVLDLSSSFSLSAIPWTLTVAGPKTAYHAITYGGPKNSQLFLFGGLADPALLNYTDATLNVTTATDPLINQTLFIYDTGNSAWSNPIPKTPEPSRRSEHTLSTRSDTGIAYLFGGVPLTADLYSLDTITLAWTLLTSSNTSATPSPRFHHTSTLLPDGRLIVLGGFDGTAMIDMHQIWSYDTNTGKWTLSNTTGSFTPTSRRDHVAVATRDGKIILHGGTDLAFMVFMSDVAVLDCSGTSYVWNAPQIKGNAPAGRYTHTATMAGTNMIVAFGFLANQTGDSNIYILDTTNFTWLDNYTPSHLDYTFVSTGPQVGMSRNLSSEASMASSSSVGIIAGTTVASLAAIVIFSVALFFFVRHRRLVKSDLLYTQRYEDWPSNPQPVSYSQWGATPGRTPAPPIRKNLPNTTAGPSAVPLNAAAKAGFVATMLSSLESKKDAVWREIGALRRGSQSSVESEVGPDAGVTSGSRFEVMRRSEDGHRSSPRTPPRQIDTAQGPALPSSPTDSSASTYTPWSPTSATAKLLPQRKKNNEKQNPPNAAPGPSAPDTGFLQPPPQLQQLGRLSPVSVMTEDLDLDGRAVPLDVGVRSYFVPRQKLFVVNPDSDGRSASAGSLKSELGGR
ncbi:hypothetical protein BC938DRAFT_476708, partial [Jimgerdemannia flammicorona]